jgi:hypothetical protein
MRPGQLKILNEHQAYVTPGDVINEEGIHLCGGGYICYYCGSRAEKHEIRMLRDCIRDAMYKVLSFGSESAVKVANQWNDFLNSRTPKICR